MKKQQNFDVLTARQLQILFLILESLEYRGRHPTQAELMRATGIKHYNGIRSHLLALTKKGLIKSPSKHTNDTTHLQGCIPLVRMEIFR